MKISIFSVLAVLIFGNLAFAQNQPVSGRPAAGNFDSYELAMIDHHQFCEQHPAEAECTTAATPFGGLVLHGLWPDRQDDSTNQYQSCGVNPIPRQMNWCSAEIDVSSLLSPELFSLLSETVPGTGTCLYNHEWNVHGSCSGLSVQDYFSDALFLDQQFNSLAAINRLVLSSRGQVLSRSQFIDALNQDLGPQSADSAVVTCVLDKNSGAATFSQLVIDLDKNHFMEFPNSISLGMLKPALGPNGDVHKDVGNCPMEGIRVAP